jgi:sugar lactone lactonase YvrE
MTDTSLLVDGLGFPESVRWHDGRVWVCNWGAGEVLAVDADGTREIMARIAPDTIPFSIDWLPDGRLVLVDGPRRYVRVQDADGTLHTLADLSALSPAPFNELVVTAAGVLYVNGGSGSVVRVLPDGAFDVVAGGLQWPNGMAVLDDRRTLVVADSHARQLIAFDLEDDGALARRRVWAELEHAPDGICADADGAVWVATVPGRRCIRVAEGGVIHDTVRTDRGCFACMLGGEDADTLYIAAAQWRGMDAAMNEGPGRTGQLLVSPGRAAPHAGRP